MVEGRRQWGGNKVGQAKGRGLRGVVSQSLRWNFSQQFLLILCIGPRGAVFLTLIRNLWLPEACSCPRQKNPSVPLIGALSGSSA